MAIVDIRRIIRNYLPIPYRNMAIEYLIYSLLGGMERINDELIEAANEYRYTISDPEVYSIAVVDFNIRQLYGAAPQGEGSQTSRIFIEDGGSKIKLTFGVNYTTNDEFHLNQIRPLIPAGVSIEINYDTP